MLSRLETRCKCSQKSDENYYDRFFKGAGLGGKLLESDDSFKFGLENASSHTLVKAIENRVTLIIREFEYFENDIPETLYSFMEIFPNMSILIITDTKPYPPMNFDKLNELQLKNLKIISLRGNPFKSVTQTHPENFIKTKYMLFWPDSVRLSSALQISKLITNLEDSNSKIVAAKVAGAKGKCLNVEVDLLKWTLTIEYPKKPSLNCNYLEGNHVVLMQFEVFQELSHPWSRPFPNSLLIQTSLRSLKIHMADKVLFLSGKPLFTESHSQWKRDSFWNVRRSNFFADFGIKKVTDENGDITWYGCAKTSQRCFGTIVNDMPEYLYENRWTPPCCLEHLRETTRHVVRILEKCGVRYWLEGGSLLGAARYEDIIPWDYDVDIGIYKDDIPKCEWLKNSQKQSIVDTKGFVWEKAKEGDFFRVQYSATNHLHVDLFPFYSKDGVMTKDTWFMTHKQDTEFPEHFLMPLITIKFVGIYVAAPNNVRDFLELKFGKNVIEKPEYPSPKLLKFPFSK